MKYVAKPKTIQSCNLLRSKESILECLAIVYNNPHNTSVRRVHESGGISYCNGVKEMLFEFGDWLIRTESGYMYTLPDDVFMAYYSDVRTDSTAQFIGEFSSNSLEGKKPVTPENSTIVNEYIVVKSIEELVDNCVDAVANQYNLKEPEKFGCLKGLKEDTVVKKHFEHWVILELLKLKDKRTNRVNKVNKILTELDKRNKVIRIPVELIDKIEIVKKSYSLHYVVTELETLLA